jgi:hypothetical protein
MRPRAFTFGRARGLDHRFGDSLGVERAGALGFRESLVTILSPFSSRYIATTIVPSWSALGRITDPSGVSSLEPSVRVILVPVSSTLCTGGVPHYVENAGTQLLAIHPAHIVASPIIIR